MKTTDSVMREFEDKFGMCFQPFGEKLDEAKDFLSHSLAEARREWVEVVRGMKKKRLDSPRGLGDGQVVNVAPGYNQAIDDVADLLTRDNPEESYDQPNN